MAQRKHRSPDEDAMVVRENDLRILPYPSILSEEETPGIPWRERALIKVGAMAQTPQYKPFWNPAFVGASALILTLLLTLVGFIWNYAQLSRDSVNFQNQLKEVKDENRDLRKAIEDQKDYTRDAIDQLARDIGVPSPKPRPHQER